MVFSYIQGMGRNVCDKCDWRVRLSKIMGVTLVAGLVFSIVEIVVDVAYTFLDPRVRLTEKFEG